ncbi:ATP synthase F1 subunit delta [bacterium]|nr:MAG: ATP synthase F1 subunit delta [bacterium]
MKQNHKKIKIYSEALCKSVNTFETFQNIKVSLNELTALSKKDLTINTFLKSKSVDMSKKMDIFTESFKEVFDKNLLEVLLVMIENDDMNLLIDINKSFVVLVKEKLNIAYVEVTSSAEMDENMRNQLSDKLSDITSKKIDINFSTNKDLIGGLKIKIDDMLFDSSLKTKLENAKSKLIGV